MGERHTRMRDRESDGDAELELLNLSRPSEEYRPGATI